MIVIESDETSSKHTAGGGGSGGLSGRGTKGTQKNQQQLRRSTEERVMTSKPSIMNSRDNETSNCDYVSEIFREQLSELEYSKLLAETDERDPTHMNIVSGGDPTTFFSGDQYSSYQEIDSTMRFTQQTAGNNSKLKALVSPIGSLESPLENKYYLQNNGRGRILHQICEVDSSKAKESSHGDEDLEGHDNFYNLTLSSKAHTVNGESAIRSSRLNNHVAQTANSQPRKPIAILDTHESGPVVNIQTSSVLSGKPGLNRKMPPPSMIPTAMMIPQPLSRNEPGFKIKKSGSAAPGTFQPSSSIHQHIKISDEWGSSSQRTGAATDSEREVREANKMAIIMKINRSGANGGSNSVRQQYEAYSVRKDSEKKQSAEEKKDEITPQNRQKVPPGKIQVTQNTASPSRGYSAKTFEQSIVYMKSNPSTASNQDRSRSTSEFRQATAAAHKNSDGKVPMTVVYDEYKYVQRPFDPNGEDYQKMNIQMIQLSKKPPHIDKPSRGQITKKEDKERNMKIIQYSPVSAIACPPAEGYQLSENEHQMFSQFSPCKLSSTQKIDAISGENRHLRANSDVNLADVHNHQINDLKNHIRLLEKQLKFSEQRSLEMLQKMSFSVSELTGSKKGGHSPFHRAKNPGNQNAYDGEDSLLQSEMRAYRRHSHVPKYPNHTPNAQEDAGPIQQHQSNDQIQQNSNSIINLKIDRKESSRPQSLDFSAHKSTLNTLNLKQQQEPPVEDFERATHRITHRHIPQEELMRYEPGIDFPTEPRSDEELGELTKLDYNVTTLKIEDSPKKASSLVEVTANAPSPNCQFCECLRQLVFQAKDCIEDLKSEIDEWKEVCSEKDAELRSIYHKLFNDKSGIEKQLIFQEDVRTLKFDGERPVNTIVPGEKMKNFIVENKKKIRSRSRNNERKNMTQGGSTAVSKKSNLKKVKEAVFSPEAVDFALYVDQGVQTQYLDFDLRDLSHQMSTIAIVPATGLQSNFGNLDNQQTPFRLGSDTDQQSPLKRSMLEDLFSLKQQNTHLEQEVANLRSQLQQATKSCEVFIGIAKKVQRSAKVKENSKVSETSSEQLPLTEIKVRSQLESQVKVGESRLQRPSLSLLLAKEERPSTGHRPNLRPQTQNVYHRKQQAAHLQAAQQQSSESVERKSIQQTTPSDYPDEELKQEQTPPQLAKLQDLVPTQPTLPPAYVGKSTTKQPTVAPVRPQSSAVLSQSSHLASNSQKQTKKVATSTNMNFDHIWKEQQERFRQLQKQQEEYLDILRGQK